MSVVRLELTVPDEAAADVANELATRYLGSRIPGVTAGTVDVRTDAEARRDRTLLLAAAYFLPEGP
jgi:hypothetical protein